MSKAKEAKEDEKFKKEKEIADAARLASALPPPESGPLTAKSDLSRFKMDADAACFSFLSSQPVRLEYVKLHTDPELKRRLVARVQSNSALVDKMGTVEGYYTVLEEMIRPTDSPTALARDAYGPIPQEDLVVRFGVRLRLVTKLSVALSAVGVESAAIDTELTELPEDVQRRWLAMHPDRIKWKAKEYRDFLEQEQRERLLFDSLRDAKKPQPSSTKLETTKQDKVPEKQRESGKKGLDFVCAACGEIGHKVRFCKNEEKKTDFYSRAAKGDAEALKRLGIPKEYISMIAKVEGGLYVKANVGQHLADLLVDTGTVGFEGMVSPEAVETLELKVTDAPYRVGAWVRSADGRRFRLDRVATCNVDLGTGGVHSLLAYVAPGLPVDIVVGMKWLSKVGAKIDVKERTVTFDDKALPGTIMRYGSTGPPPHFEKSERF